MAHYKRKIKQLKATRKLLGKKRWAIDALFDEGLTMITFHSGTSRLSLPFEEQGDVREMGANLVQAYRDSLIAQRKSLKREIAYHHSVAQQDKQYAEEHSAFAFAARTAAMNGQPPIAYPLAQAVKQFQ